VDLRFQIGIQGSPDGKQPGRWWRLDLGIQELLEQRWGRERLQTQGRSVLSSLREERRQDFVKGVQASPLRWPLMAVSKGKGATL
jgi:hypothetical protein